MADQEGISQDQMVDPGIDQRLQTRLIGDTIQEVDGCQKFAQWVEEADMGYVLRRSGLHTLFVPSNEAFQPPASDDAEEYLYRHLVSGAQESFDLSRCARVRTLGGGTLEVAEGGARIGGAKVVRSDVACTNGIVHIVDSEVQAANAA